MPAERSRDSLKQKSAANSPYHRPPARRPARSETERTVLEYEVAQTMIEFSGGSPSVAAKPEREKSRSSTPLQCIYQPPKVLRNRTVPGQYRFEPASSRHSSTDPPEYQDSESIDSRSSSTDPPEYQEREPIDSRDASTDPPEYQDPEPIGSRYPSVDPPEYQELETSDLPTTRKRKRAQRLPSETTDDTPRKSKTPRTRRHQTVVKRRTSNRRPPPAPRCQTDSKASNKRPRTYMKPSERIAFLETHPCRFRFRDNHRMVVCGVEHCPKSIIKLDHRSRYDMFAARRHGRRRHLALLEEMRYTSPGARQSETMLESNIDVAED